MMSYGRVAPKMEDTPAECIRPSERWAGLQNILCSTSPLAHPDFEPSEEVSKYAIHKDKVIGPFLYQRY